MADSFSDLPSESAPAPTTSGADVEMAETTTTSAGGGVDDNTGAADLPFAEGGAMDEDVPPAPRVTFAQHLATPIVTLLVGGETILTAHQGLLVQSPFFEGACEEFDEDGSVGLSVLLFAGGGV